MGSTTPTPPFNIKRICIIGAGPTGLAAAKYLLAEGGAFEKIDIFEQQSQAGGIWYYTKETAGVIDVPQTTPHVPVEKPLERGNHELVFPTAMYEKLHTNIPKGLMQFSDKAFPEDSNLFPSREDVLDYIQDYAQEIKHLISYSTQVQDIKLHQEDGRDIWTVTTKNLLTTTQQTATYDAIVIASGHYTTPNLPPAPGIQAWNAAYPGSITHSKHYRSPTPFSQKKVIVVGNHASGLDIGAQILGVCQKPLLNSVKHKIDTPLPDGKEEVGVIEEYIVENRTVRFSCGRVETGVDAVVYCTGYFYSYPFLETLEPPIITTGARVIGTYKHLFHTPHPTLAFTALPQKIIPFPFSEAQSAIIARVWSNRLELPSQEAMEVWERRTVAERGDGGSFNVLGYPADANYVNEMADWAALADGAPGVGKEGPRWGKKFFWVRERYVEILRAFVEGGCRAKTMEELGFDFEKEEREGEGKMSGE